MKQIREQILWNRMSRFSTNRFTLDLEIRNIAATSLIVRRCEAGDARSEVICIVSDCRGTPRTEVGFFIVMEDRLFEYGSGDQCVVGWWKRAA